MPVLAWSLLVPAGLTLLLWLAVAARVWRVVRARPSVRRGLDLDVTDEAATGDATTWPPVSIIVPVHDEADVIDRCATSLREQAYPTLEIIFVLDRCTDGTRVILERHAAEDDRVRLVINEDCPDDWAGKCNAAWLGAQAARGARLVFTDADTIFDRDLIRAAVALARDRGLGLLSLLSTLTVEHPHERIAQPVATMNLVRLYPINRVNRTDHPRPFANGQFMLFDRAWYDRIDGHAGVKDDLLEDIAFARRLHKAGGRGGLFLADGMLRCSMYDSLAAFRSGWKRIFVEACHRKAGRLRQNGLRVLVAGLILPAAQVAALATGLALRAADPPLAVVLVAVVLAGWIVQGLTLTRVYAMGGTPPGAVIFYPLGCWIVAGILMEAARDLTARKPIAWGGREYVLEPRD